MTLDLSPCPGRGSEALVAYRGHPAQGEGESNVWGFAPETVVGSSFFTRPKFTGICSMQSIGKIYSTRIEAVWPESGTYERLRGCGQAGHARQCSK